MFLKEVFGRIILLLIFFGLKHSTEARGKPMSTFNNFQQLNSLNFAILTSWPYLCTIILHIILNRVCPAYNKRPHLRTTLQDENRFKRFPLFG